MITAIFWLSLGVVLGYAFRGVLGRYFKWAVVELKSKLPVLTVK